MRRILEAKELDEVVYGSCMPPAPVVDSKDDGKAKTSEAPVTDGKNFKKLDARAAMHLINALDEKNLTIVEACITARDIWNRLELEYANKEPIDRKSVV